MWDLSTALLAVAVVTGSAPVLPSVARGVGGAWALIDCVG